MKYFEKTATPEITNEIARALRIAYPPSRVAQMILPIGSSLALGALLKAKKLLSSLPEMPTPAKKVVEEPYIREMGKFGAKLKTIAEKVNDISGHNWTLGADPEIMGIRKKISLLGKTSQGPHNVGEGVARYKSGAGNYPEGKIERDGTVLGLELGPNPSHNNSEIVQNLKSLLRRAQNNHLRSGETLSNRAAILDPKNKKVDYLAGGHIHTQFDDEALFSDHLERGMMGSLLNHYVVPGAKERAFSSLSYGSDLMENRGLREFSNTYIHPKIKKPHTVKTMEIRHSPTWMGSPELALNSLDNTRITTYHPEYEQLVNKAAKDILSSTGGQVRKLYEPQNHKKVMKFYENLYKKLGVSGDPVTEKIFNQAASGKPFPVDDDIMSSWFKDEPTFLNYHSNRNKGRFF